MRAKQAICAGLIFISVLTPLSIGCSKQESKEGKDGKQLNLYVDVKDKHSSEILKYLIDEFKKENSGVKVNVNTALGNGEGILADINKGTEADIIFTSRNRMIELAGKGVLTELGSTIEKNKVSDRYYNIMFNYGRVGEKYYGIGIIPYSIEIFYNKNALTKLKMSPPTNIKDIQGIMKTLNSSGSKVPAILTDDLDKNLALGAIVASNRVKIQKLEGNYGSGAAAYNEMKEMQTVFDVINDITKTGSLNKNALELGNENTIQKFISGDIPILAGISYYAYNLDNENIGVLEHYIGAENPNEAVPIIINAVACVPTNNKNGEEVEKFFKYAYSDEIQGKLVKKGFITGNKKANQSLSGVAKVIQKHIEAGDDNSIVFVYNMPEKFQGVIAAKIENILGGTYNKKEWEEVVSEVYK